MTTAGCKVLLVEDVHETRLRISSVLQRHGFDVVSARNGREGLHELRNGNGPFSAILLDLIMPDVNGWEFRETQRRVHDWARIPTIVVTVQPLGPAERYALRAAAVLTKPFEDSTLVETVTKVTTPGWLSPGPARADAIAHGPVLFWSRAGEVACREHAPDQGSDRWITERWAAIPGDAPSRLEYQCQHCSGLGPIIRRSRS